MGWGTGDADRVLWRKVDARAHKYAQVHAQTQAQPQPQPQPQAQPQGKPRTVTFALEPGSAVAAMVAAAAQAGDGGRPRSRIPYPEGQVRVSPPGSSQRAQHLYEQSFRSGHPTRSSPTSRREREREPWVQKLPWGYGALKTAAARRYLRDMAYEFIPHQPVARCFHLNPALSSYMPRPSAAIAANASVVGSSSANDLQRCARSHRPQRFFVDARDRAETCKTPLPSPPSASPSSSPHDRPPERHSPSRPDHSPSPPSAEPTPSPLPTPLSPPASSYGRKISRLAPSFGLRPPMSPKIVDRKPGSPDHRTPEWSRPEQPKAHQPLMSQPPCRDYQQRHLDHRNPYHNHRSRWHEMAHRQLHNHSEALARSEQRPFSGAYIHRVTRHQVKSSRHSHSGRTYMERALDKCGLIEATRNLSEMLYKMKQVVDEKSMLDGTIWKISKSSWQREWDARAVDGFTPAPTPVAVPVSVPARRRKINGKNTPCEKLETMVSKVCSAASQETSSEMEFLHQRPNTPASACTSYVSQNAEQKTHGDESNQEKESTAPDPPPKTHEDLSPSEILWKMLCDSSQKLSSKQNEDFFPNQTFVSNPSPPSEKESGECLPNRISNPILPRKADEGVDQERALLGKTPPKAASVCSGKTETEDKSRAWRRSEKPADAKLEPPVKKRKVLKKGLKPRAKTADRLCPSRAGKATTPATPSYQAPSRDGPAKRPRTRSREEKQPPATSLFQRNGPSGAQKVWGARGKAGAGGGRQTVKRPLNAKSPKNSDDSSMLSQDSCKTGSRIRDPLRHIRTAKKQIGGKRQERAKDTRGADKKPLQETSSPPIFKVVIARKCMPMGLQDTPTTAVSRLRERSRSKFAPQNRMATIREHTSEQETEVPATLEPLALAAPTLAEDTQNSDAFEASPALDQFSVQTKATEDLPELADDNLHNTSHTEESADVRPQPAVWPTCSNEAGGEKVESSTTGEGRDGVAAADKTYPLLQPDGHLHGEHGAGDAVPLLPVLPPLPPDGPLDKPRSSPSKTHKRGGVRNRMTDSNLARIFQKLFQDTFGSPLQVPRNTTLRYGKRKDSLRTMVKIIRRFRAFGRFEVRAKHKSCLFKSSSPVR